MKLADQTLAARAVVVFRNVRTARGFERCRRLAAEMVLLVMVLSVMLQFGG